MGNGAATLAAMLKGKRIIITGASAGIGLALAKALTARGARLGLIARDEARLENARSEILQLGGEACARAGDVADASTIAGVIDALADALGGLDGMIANAGFCRPGHFHEVPLDRIAAQIATNFGGVVYALHAAMPHLLRSGNAPFMVLTSSPAGELPIYGFNVYGATKAAINHLAETLRQEYGPSGVHILTLLPPDTATPGYAEEVRHYPAATREILAKGRVYTPEAVAEACVRALEEKRDSLTLGLETRMGLWLGRHFPNLWRRICERAIRRSARSSP